MNLNELTSRYTYNFKRNMIRKLNDSSLSRNKNSSDMQHIEPQWARLKVVINKQHKSNIKI